MCADQPEDMSAGQVVDTLFGPSEIPSGEERRRRAVEEAMPSYFFYEPDEQEPLPLGEAERYIPVVTDEPELTSLLPYLDELALFEGRWGFVRENVSRDEWCRLAEIEVVPVLNGLMDMCVGEMILQPRAVYVYCACAAEGETLYIYKDDEETVAAEIPFPRFPNGSCAADRFYRTSAPRRDTVGVIAATMGKNISEIARKWLLAGHEADFRSLRGFALEMLAAMTEYTAAGMIREGCCAGRVHSLGSAKEGNGRIQAALIDLTAARQIDIGFSRNYLMTPEYSSLSLLFPR